MGREYDWFGTHHTRALAHKHLQDAGLGGWRLVGIHGRNGEVWLGQETTTLRMLHTFAVEHVPAPGLNVARRAYYCNTPLPEIEAPVEPELFRTNRLLGLWRVTKLDPFEVGIRVVRTIGTWKYRAKARTDLDVLLPREVDDFSNLEWTPIDFGLELEMPDNDVEEEGEDETGGIRG